MFEWSHGLDRMLFWELLFRQNLLYKLRLDMFHLHTMPFALFMSGKSLKNGADKTALICGSDDEVWGNTRDRSLGPLILIYL